MTGIIQGGWNYVVLAYGVTTFILTLYALRTLFAARQLEQDVALERDHDLE